MAGTGAAPPSGPGEEPDGKPVGIRHGRATVTGERPRGMPLGGKPPGKARGSDDPGVRRPASGAEGAVPRVKEAGQSAPAQSRGRLPSQGRPDRPRVTAGKEDSMRRLLVLGAVAIVGAGCAAQPEPRRSSEGSADPAFPVSVEAANGTVEIPERPERIVSLSPTSTEVLFAIGAGDQVEAVDDASNYPAEAPQTDLSGYEPNVEAIAGYEPDLVVMAEDPGGLEKALEALDLAVLAQPAAQSLGDTYLQIEQLGTTTGHREEAAALISDMQRDIEELVATAPTFQQAPTYYHELDDTYFTVTSDTFIGQVYALVGLENIADAARGAGTGYPQLSAEYILQANPDFIFLSDTKCCGESAETVARRPGWGRIGAVQDGAVVELDDDIASRWGPRVVDFLRAVVEALQRFASGSS